MLKKEREAPNSAVNEKQETILSQVGHGDDGETNNNQFLKKLKIFIERVSKHCFDIQEVNLSLF